MGKHEVKDIIISVVLGYVLYSLTALSFLISFPLLMLSRRYGYKEVLLSATVLFGLIIGTNLWQVRGVEFTQLLFCNQVIGLFIPFSLLSASVLWVKEEGQSVIKRWFITILPSLVCFVAIVIWLSLNPTLTTELVENFRQVFELMWNEMLQQLGINLTSFFDVVMLVLVNIFLPLTVLIISVVSFVATASLKAHDPSFNDSVANFSISERGIWPLLSSWTLVLLGKFVSYPLAVSTLVIAFACISTFVYTFEGFTILYYYRKKNRPLSKAINMFFALTVISLFLPGVNIVLVFILSILGILETWFTLKK